MENVKKPGTSNKKRGPGYMPWERRGLSLLIPKPMLKLLRIFYSNLAADLVRQLPLPTNRFGSNSVKEYYSHLNLVNKIFHFSPVAEESVLKLLQQIDPSKAVGLDNLGGRFLKDGESELSRPITQLNFL